MILMIVVMVIAMMITIMIIVYMENLQSIYVKVYANLGMML